MTGLSPAVFLDRDGVVNDLVYYEDHGIVDSPFTAAQLQVFPGAGETVRKLRLMGYKVVLASNQPAMAKGRMSREAFERIRSRMREALAGEGGILDGEYYCHHHPEAVIDSFRADCECRKPKPGLLLQAARELDIDLARSWMVGDGLTDVQAGKRAGCRTVLVGRVKCELCHFMEQEDARPDAICSRVTELPDLIERYGG